MKLVKYIGESGERSGLLIENAVFDLNDITKEYSWLSAENVSLENIVTGGDKAEEFLTRLSSFIKSDSDIRKRYSMDLASLKLGPPLRPNKCFSVGRNYSQRISYVKPMLKSGDAALSGHGDDILIPKGITKFHVCSELCIIISKRTKNASIKEAESSIGAYTVGNDVGAIDILKLSRDLSSTCKSFDGFTAIGPSVVLPSQIDPLNFELRLIINGQEKGVSNTNNATFNVFELVRDISTIATLLPGDVIFTGAMDKDMEPLVNLGDIVECHGEGIGTLRNQLKEADWSIPDSMIVAVSKGDT